MLMRPLGSPENVTHALKARKATDMAKATVKAASKAVKAVKTSPAPIVQAATVILTDTMLGAPDSVKPDTVPVTVSVIADAPVAMVLLDTTKDIDNALESIKRRGGTLQGDIHVAACSILMHLDKHQDIRIVERLLSAMPDMSRKNAMRDWLAHNGPVMFDGDRPQHVKGKAVSLAAAQGTPFWKFSPEKPYEPLVISKAIEQLIKKLQKDEKETHVSHGAIILGLNKLVSDATTVH